MGHSVKYNLLLSEIKGVYCGSSCIPWMKNILLALTLIADFAEVP